MKVLAAPYELSKEQTIEVDFFRLKHVPYHVHSTRANRQSAT